jgi:predicted small secreted protein
MFAKTGGWHIFAHMKRICLLLLVGMALSSCNTTIGLGRDMREGYDWTRGKFQEARHGSGGGNHDVVY